MVRRGVLAVGVCSMCILGCGSSTRGPGTMGAGGPDSGVPGAAALSVSPTAQRVLAGSGAVSLRATLVGDSVPIGWTLSGPGTLGPSSGPQTTYTPPATVDAETTATVTANAGPRLRSAVTITVVPSTEVDVAGRVVGLLGNGLTGLTVAIGDRTTTTGADGRFSIPGVTPPYDLAIVLSGTPVMAGLYHGLTRPDPTLVFLFFVDSIGAKTGVISGTVSGGDPIPSDGEVTGAVFASPEASGVVSIGSRDYSLPLSWFGPATTIGTVHLLQWRTPMPGAPPTAYTAFGTVTAIRVTDGETVSVGNDPLYDPGAASISGTAVPPAGYQLFSKTLDLEFADDAILPIGGETNAETHFAFPVPRNITLTAVVTAAARLDGTGDTFRRESGITRGATDVTIVLPTPAVPSTPVDGGTGVSTSTDFRWRPLAGGVHLAIFNGEATKPSFYVVTAEASTHIPDLPALGAALPSASRYSWFVVGYAPFASVDAYTGIGALVPPIGSFEGSISDPRGFTTR